MFIAIEEQANYLTMTFPVVTAYTLVVLVLDAYMFIFTVRTTWRHYVESKSLGQSGITYVLLRDGEPI